MNPAVKGFAPSALAAITDWPWPGNVRELENAIERAVVVGAGPELRREDLPFGGPPGTGEEPAARSLSSAERTHIARILQDTNWNISRAARTLEIDRVTLYNKIKKYGLDRNGRT